MLSHSGFLVRVARLELAASWSQMGTGTYFEPFSLRLERFAPEMLLFETLISTVSMCSKPGYDQICGQKPLPAKSGKRFTVLRGSL